MNLLKLCIVFTFSFFLIGNTLTHPPNTKKFLSDNFGPNRKGLPDIHEELGHDSMGPVQMDGQIIVEFDDPCEKNRDVFINGEIEGRTNSILTVQPGHHQISLSGKGYVPEVHLVKVEYGNMQVVKFKPKQELCQNE